MSSIRSSFVPGCQDQLLPYTPNILHLIACIGTMHRVLTKPFLATFGKYNSILICK